MGFCDHHFHVNRKEEVCGGAEFGGVVVALFHASYSEDRIGGPAPEGQKSGGSRRIEEERAKENFGWELGWLRTKSLPGEESSPRTPNLGQPTGTMS